jgi:uncharacterized membrane protein
MAQKKPASRSHDTLRDDDRLARFRRMPKILRIVYARPRFFIAVGIGLVSLLLLPASLRAATRLLLAWDISLVFYLTLAYATVFAGERIGLRRVAAIQDDGRYLILGLTSVAAFASLAAIVFELGAPHYGSMQLALAVVTILLSWVAIHTTFALHYAHEFYRGGNAGGLAFPGDGDDPDYWDFVYFSFVIGMTAQVSDVGITDKVIRRTATAHGIASFFFNTALLALMINIAGSALSSG